MRGQGRFVIAPASVGWLFYVRYFLFVMPFVRNVPAFPILRVLDLYLFLFGNLAVGQRSVFHLLNMFLAFFQARRFLGRKLARCFAGFDACRLVLLALVDALCRL